jgi:hypothetical protein
VITDGGMNAVGGGSGKVVDERDGYGEPVDVVDAESTESLVSGLRNFQLSVARHSFRGLNHIRKLRGMPISSTPMPSPMRQH